LLCGLRNIAPAFVVLSAEQNDAAKKGAAGRHATVKVDGSLHWPLWRAGTTTPQFIGLGERNGRILLALQNELMESNETQGFGRLSVGLSPEEGAGMSACFAFGCCAGVASAGIAAGVLPSLKGFFTSD